MSRAVWVDGARVTLTPTALVGQGGEAEVYDLGDGRVLKWWKPPEHPDFEGLPHEQATAARRLAEQPAKLRTLPGNLPAAVVAPCGFALAGKRSTEVVGYVMPKIAGTPLHDYGEPRWRREHPIEGATLVAALLALHDAIAGLHRAGVVIGDCNDLNVLVDDRNVHLIDVDSYQFGGFTCPMFSERFVDPRLCDAQQLVPVRPHDVDSDWFAFAVMVFRSLFGVGPWGGVSRHVVAAHRALRRISVLGADITYPRAARPLAMVPDDVIATFREIFENDQRGVFPRALLERLHLRRCTSCGEEHARVRCPGCQTVAHVPPALVHGRLRYHPIPLADVARGSVRVGRAPDGCSVWFDGGTLMRTTRLGPERIGSVLAGQTHAWVGGTLGIGFYRAGGYARAFIFRPDRGGLDDRIALPKIRGQLVTASANVAPTMERAGVTPASGDDRAWLWLTCSDGGRLVTTCVVVDASAEVIATATLDDAPWIAGVPGACVAGAHLFVPTEDGVARVEVVQGTIALTRVFAETAPLVGTADRLALSPGGIDVVRRRDAIRMQLA